MLAGRYRMGEVIGRGGMSTVHRATDTVLDRDVAVKLLLPVLAESDPAHIARFEREARAAAALQHPAVVKIYDTGRDGASHFIVMEYLGGRSVAELLAPGRPLAPDAATRIAGRVAEALAAAHAGGILHRDIKPANVMIGPGGELKVLDFGIARARQDPTLTQPTFAIGTAAYMSPERALGRSGDERSDIYSLGCLLYAMLTGRPPFVADHVMAVLHQHVHEQPVPPRRLGVEIAPPLESLVLAMLAKDPAARPRAASEVAGRLSGPAPPLIAAGAMDPAASPAWRRPRPLGAAALAAALALVVALLASGSGQPRLVTNSLGGVKARADALSDRRADVRTAQPLSQQSPASPEEQPPAQSVPPGHDGIPPGHADGGPPGHNDEPPEPPKPAEGPDGHGGPPGAGGD
jgi:serine/threonine-protein kinase